MLPLAHIGTAMLVAKVARSSTTFAALGALAPDLIDKPPAWVARMTPSGRYFGHSLPCCLLLTVTLMRTSGRDAGLGFGVGYLSHLAGDSEGFVPWLMPFVAHDGPKDDHFPLEFSRQLLAREAVGLALILLLARPTRRRKLQGSR